MVHIDPKDLTPDIDPATGIDLGLIRDNLRMTPWERLQANNSVLKFIQMGQDALAKQTHAPTRSAAREAHPR
jgi:hypothetical protein